MSTVDTFLAQRAERAKLQRAHESLYRELEAVQLLRGLGYTVIKPKPALTDLAELRGKIDELKKELT
ncbi:hypothetical protein [Streptomyces sp. AC495_CC817]|uniref:hypothetical protein n=1 Tax=Streptomyces sp. AC495_CC817 TaxID=2823900 RepID=UPI001C27AB31|nr:hypothetical protein [Streptomyces sp. AC495_CC817]